MILEGVLYDKPTVKEHAYRCLPGTIEMPCTTVLLVTHDLCRTYITEKKGSRKTAVLENIYCIRAMSSHRQLVENDLVH